ncbi:hypothetical protein EDB84DRAFT_1454984 [Lactarius hengduanensis]|nr:hypothetical protein EDB84DRAFT_1454984 [Lactarius hengduanensis]
MNQSCASQLVDCKRNKSTSTFSNGNPETSLWTLVHENNHPCSNIPTSKISKAKTSPDDNIDRSSRTSATTVVKSSDLQERLSSPSRKRNESISSASPKDRPDPSGTKGVAKRVTRRCSSDPVAITSFATFPYHVRGESRHKAQVERFCLRAIHLIGTGALSILPQVSVLVLVTLGYKRTIYLEDRRVTGSSAHDLGPQACDASACSSHHQNTPFKCSCRHLRAEGSSIHNYYHVP